MPAFTTVLGLYKAGGGSTGLVTPDEPVDIDKINANFDLLDSAVGLRPWTTGTRPSAPFINQLGYNSTLDIYEKWNGSTWVNALPSYLQSTALGNSYFTKTQLTSGTALDSRYFTQTDLLTGKKLDSIYYSKTAIKFDSGSALTGSLTLDATTGRYYGSVPISFKTNFTAEPMIAGACVTADPGGCTFQLDSSPGPTSNGFNAFITRRNNLNTGFRWLAIGV